MKFGVAIEIDSSIDHLSNAVTEFSSKLDACLRKKFYGEGIDNIFVGLILTHPDLERLHGIRKFKFTKEMKGINRISRQRFDLANVVEYDVRPDFSRVTSSNSEQAIQYIAETVLDSLSQLEHHKRKFPKFNVEEFRRDVEKCLLECPRIFPASDRITAR